MSHLSDNLLLEYKSVPGPVTEPLLYELPSLTSWALEDPEVSLIPSLPLPKLASVSTSKFNKVDGLVVPIPIFPVLSITSLGLLAVNSWSEPLALLAFI